MPYQSNIPQAGTLLSQSQGDILGNFVAVGTLLAPNVGSHLFPVQAGNPGMIATTQQIFAKTGAVSGVAELYTENAAGAVPMYGFTESVKAVNGWTMLPSGVILQWGNNTQVGGQNNTNFNFTIAFPTACLSITGSPNAVPGGAFTDIIMAISVASPAQYNVQRKTNFGSNLSFNWFAIGY